VSQCRASWSPFHTGRHINHSPKQQAAQAALALTVACYLGGSLFSLKKILDQQIQSIIEFRDSREILISYMEGLLTI
ncbi:mCG1033797, partial [Mus musculus]